MDMPNCIILEETVSEETHASGARLLVRIRGESFFTGNEAFKKATEVRQFLADVNQCGLTEEDVTLQGVTTEVSSGLLGKSSGAMYALRVRCASVELVGPVLSAVASQKNCELVSIDWRYPQLDELHGKLLDECTEKAKRRAGRIAGALGVRLVGVRKFQHEFIDPERIQSLLPQGASLRAYAASALKARASEALSTLNLSHVNRIGVKVSAEFIVGDFES